MESSKSEIAAKNYLGKTGPTWRLEDGIGDSISPHQP